MPANAPEHESEAQRINRSLAEAAAEAEAREPDETVPGGRYQVGEQVYNAQGEPLERAEHQPAAPDAEKPPEAKKSAAASAPSTSAPTKSAEQP